MTPAERKEAMPHGGQRRAAKRVRRSETYIHLVMSDLVQPRTKRGERTLLRARLAIANEMGQPVEKVFPANVTEPTSASAA
jgi:hypothetical protein